MVKTNYKNTNIEILRIVSIFLILIHHYAYSIYTSDIYLSGGVNKYIIDAIFAGGKIGVNCFILISGYFMINSSFTIRKFFKLCGQVWFYSWGFVILVSIGAVKINDMSMVSILKSIFPIIYSKYWFITSYLILMICSPYINIIIQNASKKQLERLIIILVFIWSFLPTFCNAKTTWNTVGWFVLLYCIGAYVKKYMYDCSHKSLILSFEIAVLFMLIYIFSTIAFNYIGYVTGKNIFLKNSIWFAYDWSTFSLIIAVCLFIGFLNLNIKYNKTINIISSTTFGVYLLHSNGLYNIFINIFKSTDAYMGDTFCMICNIVISVVLIYAAGVIIDLIRQNTIEKLYIRFIDKIIDKTEIKLHERSGRYE